MTSDRSWTHRAAMAFYEWLVERKDAELPQLHEICVMLPEPIDPYRLAMGSSGLPTGHDRRAGERRANRTHHYVIRVRSTGRVYRTAGCRSAP